MRERVRYVHRRYISATSRMPSTETQITNNTSVSIESATAGRSTSTANVANLEILSTSNGATEVKTVSLTTTTTTSHAVVSDSRGTTLPINVDILSTSNGATEVKTVSLTTTTTTSHAVVSDSSATAALATWSAHRVETSTKIQSTGTGSLSFTTDFNTETSVDQRSTRVQSIDVETVTSHSTESETVTKYVEQTTNTWPTTGNLE
jgi:hypothetical protein